MHLRFALGSLALSFWIAGCGLLLDTSPPDQKPDGGSGCTTAGECNDEIPCTHDTCEAGGVCSNTPDDTLCDSTQVCGPGVGCTKPCELDVGCDYLDFGECVQGRCDLTGGSGFCRQVYDDAICADQQNCTVDVCGGDGLCTSTPSEDLCDDGIECTVDACDTSGGSQDVNGCTHVADDALCEDGVDCTVDVCDPMNALAGELSGCAFEPDDTVCALSSAVCTVGVCVPEIGCASRLTTSTCDPGTACDVASGQCAAIEGSCPDTCDDGNPCNGEETCVDTVCVAGTADACPIPFNPCYQSYCDPTDGGGYTCGERPTLACYQVVAIGP